MSAGLRWQCSALRAWLLGFGVSLLLTAASREAAADDNTRKPFDPVQIRKDMARVRARLERGRKRASPATQGRANPDRRTADAARGTERKARTGTAEHDTARAGQTLSYRFVPGQTFGYAAEIEVEQSYKTERFVGQPIFSVRSVEANGEAVIFAIGKLASFSRVRGADSERERPNQSIWIGSALKVSPSGSVGGTKDYNAAMLPTCLTTLIAPRELFFPELTSSITGLRSEKSSATLWLHTAPKDLLDLGSRWIEGTETRALRASPLSGTLVQVRKERSFVGKDEPPTSLRYESTSRIDRGRGRLVDSTATCSTEAGPVTIRIRLLEGDELAQAVDQANRDWAKRPPELEPTELRRVRLEAKSLPRLGSSQDATPGMTVAHFGDDHHWYLAQVVEVVSPRTQEVRVRYQGSEEVLVVHSGQLAIPPAATKP